MASDPSSVCEVGNLMSRAVARRILVPTWVLSYMLKLRCLSITASHRAWCSGGWRGLTSDLLAERSSCWTIPPTCLLLPPPPPPSPPPPGGGDTDGGRGAAPAAH